MADAPSRHRSCGFHLTPGAATSSALRLTTPSADPSWVFTDHTATRPPVAMPARQGSWGSDVRPAAGLAVRRGPLGERRPGRPAGSRPWQALGGGLCPPAESAGSLNSNAGGGPPHANDEPVLISRSPWQPNGRMAVISSPTLSDEMVYKRPQRKWQFLGGPHATLLSGGSAESSSRPIC